MEDKILKSLDYTAVHDRLVQIRSCYHQLEKKQKEFCSTFAISCLESCGKCCENFTPDITKTEAEFLAYGLIKEGKADLVLELLKAKGESDHHCPLYIEDSPYHCSVYHWRPLICRLFGAAASKDKEGRPTFRKCKWNTDGHDLTPEEFQLHQNAVLIMSDFGEMIENIDPENNETELLPIALPRAINEIRFILELEKAEPKS